MTPSRFRSLPATSDTDRQRRICRVPVLRPRGLGTFATDRPLAQRSPRSSRGFFGVPRSERVRQHRRVEAEHQSHDRTRVSRHIPGARAQHQFRQQAHRDCSPSRAPDHSARAPTSLGGCSRLHPTARRSTPHQEDNQIDTGTVLRPRSRAGRSRAGLLRRIDAESLAPWTFSRSRG